MLAYTNSSTVLALPQVKYECPAAEPLYQKAPLWCEKSSEFFSEVGDKPTSKVHQNALFPHTKSKNFLGRGTAPPDLTRTGEGDTQTPKPPF